MADPGLVKGWIKKADEDLQYAGASFKEKLGFYPQICFHLHQAVEKYLKAYIVAKDLTFQKIHDLEFIGTIGKLEAEKALRVAEEVASFVKAKFHVSS